MSVRGWLQRLALVSVVAACGLSSSAEKHRCIADADCVAGKRCFEGICRLYPPDCEAEDCPADDGQGGDCGSGACGGAPSGGDGSGDMIGGRAGSKPEGSGGAQGGNGSSDSGGSRAGDGPAPESGTGGQSDSGGSAGADGTVTAGSSGAGGSGGCNEPVNWVDVELLPVPMRGVPAATLSRGLALVGQADCPGILFVGHALVSPNCPITAGDRVVFDKARSGGAPKPLVENVVTTVWETRNHHVIPVIHNVSYLERTPAPWAARSPLRGETLTAVSYGIDGFAKAIRLSIPPETFENPDSPQSAGPRAAIFGSDGKFLGFCRIDGCGTASACASMRSLVHESPTLPEYLGIAGVHWGDVTGGGTSDGVAINLSYVGVAPSTATSLGGTSFWLSEGFKGRLDSLLGDLDGDGLSDLVTLDPTGVTARPSTGSGFWLSSHWTADSFDTHQHVALANIDGLAGDDLASVLQGRIRVWLSNGWRFESAALWATVPSDFGDGWFSDVTGDGLADAVFAVGQEIVVLRSTGQAFETPEQWLTGESAEAPGWFFADISGDGAADALAIDARGVRLFVSDTERFNSVGPLKVEPTLGERDTSVADVNGDGKVDVITHHNERILAFLSTGADFAEPVLWCDGFFFGGI